MDVKAREIDQIFRKLGMETRNSNDLHAWFIHDGICVVRTKRSFGKGKFVPADKIRCQLKVNEDQFRGLIQCPFSKEDYITHLMEKGVIPKVEPSSADSPDAS